MVTTKSQTITSVAKAEDVEKHEIFRYCFRVIKCYSAIGPQKLKMELP
jgi:hypothetical protein